MRSKCVAFHSLENVAIIKMKQNVIATKLSFILATYPLQKKQMKKNNY